MADKSVESLVREILSSVKAEDQSARRVLSLLGESDPGWENAIEFLLNQGHDGNEGRDFIVMAAHSSVPAVGAEEVYDEIVKQMRQQIADQEENLAPSGTL